MEISSITCSNIGLLYNAVVNKMNNPETNKDFFRHMLPQLLNMCHIYVKLNIVTPLEYLYLLKFSSKVSKPLSCTNYDIRMIASNYSHNSELISSTSNIKIKIPNKCADTNGNVKYTDISEHYSPSCMNYCSYDVEFTGATLINIFTLDPEVVFAELSNGKCLNNKRYIENWWTNNYNNPEVNTVLSNLLMKKFYEYIIRMQSSDDKLTTTIFDKYYGSMFKNTASRTIPFQLYTENAHMKLIGNEYYYDDKGDYASTLIKEINTNKTTDEICDSTYIQFICSAPLDVFVELHYVLPREAFIYEENYVEFNKFYIDGYDNAQANLDVKEAANIVNNNVRGFRFGDLLKRLKNSASTELSIGNILKMMYLSNNASEIVFVLNVSFSDINHYLYPCIKDESTPSMKKYIFRSMIKNILEYSKILYQYSLPNKTE